MAAWQCTIRGAISLVADMTLNGATVEELERAIKYSASVMDAKKSYEENGIEKLRIKYQQEEN